MAAGGSPRRARSASRSRRWCASSTTTALVLAQGQENTARRDLSFIERAHFARQMAEAGYDRKTIADALTITKSEISRLLSVAERLPEGVMRAIGAAPSVGRTRWLALADLLEKTGYTATEAAVLCHGTTSDQRFEALMHALTLPERRVKEAASKAAKARKPTRHELKTATGARLGQVRLSPDKVAIDLDPEDGFARWLVARLPDLHRHWQDET